MKKSKFEMNMCEGPILPKILIFTLPLILSNILQLVFNAADIIVVGNYCGDNSMSAVGSNAALINLLTSIFIGLSVGTNVLVAKFKGAGRQEDVSETVHTSMLLSLICGIVLTVIAVVFARDFLVMMKTPEKVLDLATTYLRIYFLGTPAMMIYNFGSAVMRAVGDTKRPLIFLVIAGIINVALNMLLVIVFKMDVAGVAIATVTSQTVSAFLVVFTMLRDNGSIKLVIKKLHINKSILAQILRIGLPCGFQGALFSISNVMIQSSINSFGEVVLAGSSAASNLEGFVYMAMNAFHHATICFVSQNMGAGNIKRAKKCMMVALACVFVTGLVLGYGALLGGRFLLSIYTDSPQSVEQGMIRLKYICGTYFLCGIMEVFVGAIRGLGYAVLPMITSLVGACLLRIIWLSTVFQIPKFHIVDNIYITYPGSWIITITAHMICFIIVYNRRKKQFAVRETS